MSTGHRWTVVVGNDVFELWCVRCGQELLFDSGTLWSEVCTALDAAPPACVAERSD